MPGKKRVPVDLDPGVTKELVGPPSGEKNGRVKKTDEWTKLTVRVPADLKTRMMQEAYSLTHHKRRGFQDLVVIFLRYALDAYERGELEVTLSEKVVSYGIKAKE
jgi:hypothetical protein